MAAIFGAPVVMTAVVVVCGLIWLRSRRWHSKEMGGIPGSMGWLVVSETFSFIADFSSPIGILSFMRKRQRRYGKVFKTYVLGRVMVFMIGREEAKILMSSKDSAVTHNLSYVGKQVLSSTILLTTNGEAHKNPRHLNGQPLSFEALKKQFSFINDLAI